MRDLSCIVFDKGDFCIDDLQEELRFGLGEQLDLWLPGSFRHQPVALSAYGEDEVGRKLVPSPIGVIDLRIDFDFLLFGRTFILLAENNCRQIRGYLTRTGRAIIGIAQYNYSDFFGREPRNKSRETVDTTAVSLEVA